MHLRAFLRGGDQLEVFKPACTQNILRVFEQNLKTLDRRHDPDEKVVPKKQTFPGPFFKKHHGMEKTMRYTWLGFVFDVTLLCKRIFTENTIVGCGSGGKAP